MSRNPLITPYFLIVLLCAAVFTLSLWAGFSPEAQSDTSEALILYIRALVNSCLLAIGTTLLATLIAVPLSWLFERGEFRHKTLLNFIVTLPLFIPLVIAGTGLREFISTNDLLTTTESARGSPALLWGVLIIVQAVHLFPLIYLMSRHALRQINPTQEMIAQSLGCTEIMCFRRITLPQIKPTLWLACGVVFALALASPILPLMLGVNTLITITLMNNQVNISALNAILLGAAGILALIALAPQKNTHRT